MNVSEFVREAVREKIESYRVINIRDIDFKTAKKEILEYFQKKKGENVYPSEIMENLEIDLELVIKVLEQLRKEGKIT